ncbi:hypothetical protein [Haloparvum sedimenti]|uniref:hypothetical protein n=1 Tax=Haloparvum sedimenti TaxID=1678448 RepID=UPI00159EEAC8|nr:hypothetical protein [Haloparvum sedimenti]
MVSRENRVIAVCLAVAVLLLFGLNAVTDPPSWAILAVLLGVGVVVPTLVNEYRSRHGA